MEALTARREATEGWKVQQIKENDGPLVYVAVPPTARHYLAGMTPGTFAGCYGYGFLRSDVAEATIADYAQIRGAES